VWGSCVGLLGARVGLLGAGGASLRSVCPFGVICLGPCAFQSCICCPGTCLWGKPPSFGRYSFATHTTRTGTCAFSCYSRNWCRYAYCVVLHALRVQRLPLAAAPVCADAQAHCLFILLTHLQGWTGVQCIPWLMHQENVLGSIWGP